MRDGLDLPLVTKADWAPSFRNFVPEQALRRPKGVSEQRQLRESARGRAPAGYRSQARRLCYFELGVRPRDLARIALLPVSAGEHRAVS